MRLPSDLPNETDYSNQDTPLPIAPPKKSRFKRFSILIIALFGGWLYFTYPSPDAGAVASGDASIALSLPPDPIKSNAFLGSVEAPSVTCSYIVGDFATVKYKGVTYEVHAGIAIGNDGWLCSRVGDGYCELSRSGADSKVRVAVDPPASRIAKTVGGSSVGKAGLGAGVFNRYKDFIGE